MMKLFFAGLAMLGVANTTQVVDLYSSADLHKLKNQISQNGTRFASKELARYDHHYTMIAYREETGSSEVHEHEADVFFIQDGDAALVTGGKLIGAHAQKPGELRGTGIEGGEKRPLRTGDVVHIPAGVPHQILVTAGKPITYFVVKVAGQNAAVSSQ